MQARDKAQSFFARDNAIWVRMQSGEEIKLGPSREVIDSMRVYIAEPTVSRIEPRNRTG